jgi:uncharacterized delta-60 repeat protein
MWDLDMTDGGLDGGLDDAGAFRLGHLKNGVTYTVYLASELYNFDPKEITFTVSSSNVDNLVFSATPAAGGMPSPTPSYVDTSFGTNGVFTHKGAGAEAGNDVVADPNGGYYAMGTVGGQGAIWRLTDDGVLDTTFNTTGYRIAALNPASRLDSGLLASGQLYALGGRDSNFSNFDKTTIVCIANTGANCAGFNSGAGLVVPAFALAMSRDPNTGDLLLAGRRWVSSVQALSVTRVSSAGVPGVTYTNAGPLGIFSHNVGAGIVVDENGRAYVIGTAPVGTDYANHAYVLRLTNAMVLDTTFNSGGSIPGILDLGRGYGGPAAMDATGAVLVANGASVIRVTAAGAVDAGFASAGTLTASTRISRIVIDSTGRILLIGSPGHGTARVCRYSPAGVIDRAFNTGCITLDSPGAESGGTVDSSNRILMTSSNGLEMAVHRLNP